MKNHPYTSIRNIAVIAHVDHGKTTLVDAMLKQTHLFRENQEEMNQERILDQNDLERERGITILAKNCSIFWKGTKINIIDTPGHADFSGEVERTLSMADGALLIVDAQEGPMPQTRFVLKKALSLGLKIIVVINKIDKKAARTTHAARKIESVFLEFAATEDQLEFPVIYAVGRDGATFTDNPSAYQPNSSSTVAPLLDTILAHIPEPVCFPDKPFKMLISSLDYNPHLGRLAIGVVREGKLEKNGKLIITGTSGNTFTAEHILTFSGLGREETSSGEPGDIVAVSGLPEVQIGMTISSPGVTEPFPSQEITDPTLHMTLGPNTSPLSGREGKYVTSRQLEERLEKELESNLSLRMEKLPSGFFKISGKGELHLSVLLETMRREGYEMEVGKPEVIYKEIAGVTHEPVEEVSIIVPKEFAGVINQEMGKRLATLTSVEAVGENETEFLFQAPTRVLIGLRSLLLTLTKGTVVLSSQVCGYAPKERELPKLRSGVLIASETGRALSYGLKAAEERGITFINPGTEVYQGMIIGQNAKSDDLRINVCKGKKLTNMRSKSSDGVIQLTPATILSLEESLDFLEEDELLEITPESLRLRKKNLSGISSKRMPDLARQT